MPVTTTTRPPRPLDPARLRSTLAYHNVTTRAFARLCDVCEATISYTANGRRVPGRLVYRQILDGLAALGIDASEVLADE